MMLWLAQTGSDIGYLSADDGVSKLQEQFEGGLGIQEDDSDDGQNEFSEALEFEDRKDFSGRNGVAEGMGPEVKDDDDNDDGDELYISSFRRYSSLCGREQLNSYIVEGQDTRL
ncbi:uncharacterized protein LOC130992898 [Salvia miltiorrhiza]|uniref:uncharacterized protein LOC130992898 n=1 Tax=Salvia miltiorrhiza TaxID=226208 RepID=UPI0025AD1B27|nr:uncharacterized protein LOC130992898 [Salvia miltiorrhiza]XP_057773645.1 uncharacterized protein LOC130992898 [Salvia miltiorrhiza]